jgi:hypothetical protein
MMVLAFERAEARIGAAAGPHGNAVDVSVSGWRVAVASLRLTVRGLWTRVQKHRRRDANRE